MRLGNKFLWKDSIVNREDLKIDIFDRGYNFGDGIYEVIRIYNGQLFTQKEHLERFFNSAQKIEMNLKKNVTEVHQLITQLVQENEISSGFVYFQVTRGDIDIRSHGFKFYDDQQVVFSGFVVETKRDKKKIETPARAITTEDLRGLLCDVKSLNLLPNVLAMHQAQKKQVERAIMVRDNIVTEEKSANVMIVKDGVLYTHPDGRHILPGITKLVIRRICLKEDIPLIETAVSLQQLIEADEVLVLDTNHEVVSISEIDGNVIGNGKRGPMALKLQALYEQEIIKECGSLK